VKRLSTLLFALLICGGFVSAVSMPPVKLLAEQSGLTLLGVSDAGSAPDVFLYYSPVVVDHTKVGSGACCTAEDVNHFIVQLDYTDDRFKTLANGGHVADAQGDDIRPYSDTCTTPITGYEKQLYDGTTGHVIVNVKRDLSHTVDTTFYLCHDNPTKTTDASDASGTYSAAGYISVYHFENSGGSLNINDALGARNGVSITGTVGVTSSTGGKFGAAATPTGGTSYVVFPSTWYLANLSSNTVDVLIKTSASRAITYPYNESSDGGGQQYTFGFNISTSGYHCCQNLIKASDLAATDIKLDTSVNDGAWHLLTKYNINVDASHVSLNLTLDDGQTNTVTFTQNTGVGSNHVFTGTPDPSSSGYGSTADTIDELWLGNSATRNSAVSDPRQWVWTRNKNVLDATTFAVLGTEVAR